MLLLRSLVLAAVLASTLVAAEELRAPDESLNGVRSLVRYGKLPMALRAVDAMIVAYPTDSRLPEIRAQIARIIEREMPARKLATAVGAIPASSRPPVPTATVAVPGADFLSGGPQLAMIWIPAGTFLMSSVLGKDNDTWVTLSRGYWLGQTEVTQEQWVRLAPEDPRPSYFKGSDRPVEWVSWSKAMDFCRKLTEQERQAGRLPAGYVYTLPTEAQWEYACRAGSTGPYAGEIDRIAWHDGNSGKQTHPVGEKEPNAWGLYDMHGNVWEWCLETAASYPGGRVVDPVLEGDSSTIGVQRVIRGGAWGSPVSHTRSDQRYWRLSDSTAATLGFRVALVAEVSSPGKGGTPPASASTR